MSARKYSAALATCGLSLDEGLKLEARVVRPALMSGRSSMNMLLLFVSLLGGVAAFGLIGLVLGPVVIATVTSLLSLGAETAAR